MASAFIRRDLMGPYPEGVPNPQQWHVHPYPTRFHGGIWTRPVFGFPLAEQRQSVLLPGRDLRGPTSVGSLGALWNTGRGIFKPGGYGGGVFDGNLSGLNGHGLAGNEAIYPWGKYSAETKKLQDSTNATLKSYGYCPITADGKLGPATCGARAPRVIDTLKRGDTTTLFAIPDACPADKSQMTAPTPASSGCGTKSSSPITSLPSATPQPELMSAGMSASNKKALAFAVGGVATIGLLYLLKKKS
jgi:hypothetical protein